MLLRPRNALIAAAAGAMLLVLIWVLAFHVGAVRKADRTAYQEFTVLGYELGEPHSERSIADLGRPNPYVFLAAIPMLVALARRRPRLMLAVAMILLGANVTTQLIKLGHPRLASVFGGPIPPPPFWPSGHATAVMALTLATTLVVPARMRPVTAAAGAVFALAVSYALLSMGSHYPSDVIAGFLVAVTWTLLAIGGLRSGARRGARSDHRPNTLLGAALIPVLGAAGLTVVLLLSRPREVVRFAGGHAAFVIATAAIAAVALALAAALTLALRSDGDPGA